MTSGEAPAATRSRWHSTLVSKKEVVLLALIMVVGATLRFYKLAAKSIWVDEAIQVALAKQDIPTLFRDYLNQVSGTIAGNAYQHDTVSYTHLRAHETPEHLVCRLLLEKKKHTNKNHIRRRVTEIIQPVLRQPSAKY